MTKNKMDEDVIKSRINEKLLAGLNKASAIILQSTFDDDEFKYAFKAEIVNLGLHGSIMLLDETGENLVLHITTFPEKQFEQLERITGFKLMGFNIPVESSEAFSRPIREKKPGYINNNRAVIESILKDRLHEYKNIVHRIIPAAPVIYAPLLSFNRAKGIIAISGNCLNEIDMAPIEAFANYIAIALENLTLFMTIKENETKLKKQADDMSLINTLNDALNQKKSLHKILGLLSEETKRIFSCYGTGIYFFDKKKNTLILQDTGIDSPMKEEAEKLIGNTVRAVTIRYNPSSIYHKVMTSMKSLLVNDGKDIKLIIEEFLHGIKTDKRNIKIALEEFALHFFKIIDILSAVIVPLGTEEEPIGLLEIVRYEPFTGEDLKRFENIGRQVTTVIRRKQNEEQLTLLSHAIEQSPALVVITDVDGNIGYVNPKFTELTGYILPEVAGKKMSFIHEKKTGLPEYERIWETVFSGGEWHGETLSRKKNNDLFWEAVTIAPIKGEDGLIIHFLKVSTDITDQKRMEDELFKIKNLESLGLLAGGIAHDFNNVLTGILGNINLAKTLHEDKTSEIYEILSEAEKAGFIAKDLTHQLLTFAKGGTPIKQTQSLVSLIKETTGFALRGSSVEWSFDYPDDLWHVDVDKTQISQVINNLIINASQAMSGSGTITIKADNLKKADCRNLPIEPGNFVRIAVSDTGHGIEEHYLPKIFNPYFTTKETGTGLGLATAFSIVKRHAGFITVDSILNSGTTFTIYLPASMRKEHNHKPANTHVSKYGGKILLVDDDEIVRKVGVKLLSYLGYIVVCAKDGDEAINIFKQAKEIGDNFKVVILDLTLPGSMGGTEIVEIMHTIDPTVKALASSGYSPNGVLAHYRDYGFNGIIVKPYRIEEIGSILQTVIGG
jgi:PAS domain S-box-containing protein